MKNEKVYTIAEYQQGFEKNENQYRCLYCAQAFEEGCVYAYADKFVTAEKAIQLHLESHNGPLQALLEQPKELLGVTDTQQEILRLFAQQLSDTVIAQRLGISPSTVRNHRFKLKEKEPHLWLFIFEYYLKG